jgi:membrane-associated phospholipid phosphatase
MNRQVAFTISTLFHPIFVNLLSLFALIKLFPYLDYGLNDSLKLFFLVFIFATTGIFPLLVVLFMRFSGTIQSILLDDKEQRKLPYIITAIIYLLDFYAFKSLIHAPALILAYLLGSATIVVIMLIINHFYKISIHASSFGLLTAIIVAASGSAMFDVRILLMVTLILAGITASARLFLHAHNLMQIISGYTLGFLVMWFIL